MSRGRVSVPFQGFERLTENKAPGSAGKPLADLGGIAITQQVFDQVYNKIPELLVSIGKVKLKNIQRPVEVYRIILGHPVDSGARCNRSMKTEFGRLCQAL